MPPRACQTWASAAAGPGRRAVVSAWGEVLVGAGGVLAWPLVELLAGAAAGAVYVQAQAAILVLELPGAVGLLLWFPHAAGRAADGLLDDVGGALRGGVAGRCRCRRRICPGTGSGT